MGVQVLGFHDVLERTGSVRPVHAPRRTPSCNATLAQRLGDFATLAEGLDYAAGGETGFDFYSQRGELAHQLPYRRLREQSLATARRLLGAGLARGDRVAVVAETGPEFMVVFFACQYAGLVPCPVPYSMHIGGREAYVARIAGMMRSARASAAITPGDLEGQVAEAAGVAGVPIVLSHEGLADLAAGNHELEPFRADEVAYIQYSSGSTSHPKGVLITQAAITDNVGGILRHGLKARPGDRALSWLPLYHDMGLVGFCIAPLMGQFTVDYLSTPAFARRPALWLKLMSDNRCTISFAPSFGYELAARRINGGAAELDLSAWRVAGIGGDMVRPDILDAFAAHLSPAGFNPTAFLPSYGMAETTLGITFADLDRPVKVDVLDRAQTKLSRRAVPARPGLKPERIRSFVVCGRPLPGTRIEVRNDAGCALGEREIGHIWVRGPSLMAGYFEAPEATAAVMGDDGFMDTGDMGYWLDGELVITGRAKDLILHNGRNIWPQDIEWAVEQIAPLRNSAVAAFAVEGRDGGDEVVVLVECRPAGEAELEALRRQVSAMVYRTAGIDSNVVMVAPRSLPFTSSGKLSRAGAKADFMAGRIAEIGLRPTVDSRQPRPAPAAVG
jgi:fatty-acyl-CoA synthase